MKIFTFLNFKGGVGKTTSCQNIGSCLASKGYKVLMVDLDPQSNLSTSYQVDTTDRQTTYQAISQKQKVKPVQLSDNLYLLPNSINAIALEMELVSVLRGREYRLRESLIDAKKQFDYILIDCPPSLGLVTINGLLADENNKVLVPIEPEFLSLSGFAVLRSTLSGIDVSIHKCFLTKYDQRKVMHKRSRKALYDNMNDLLCYTFIRTNIALSEAQSLGKTIFQYDNKSNGAKDYERLTNELIKNK